MKKTGALFLLILCCGFMGASPVRASEIGVFLGGYSKDSDIDRIQNLATPGTWTSPDRSFSTYLGLTWAHNFIVPLLEFEHTLGGSFGADKSAKPNTFIYSSNLHLILPVDLMRIKPFAGVGFGYIYNFGDKVGYKDIANYLGSFGNFQVNVGGGAKVKVSDSIWLRLTLRDYILPNLKKAVVSYGTGTPYSTIKESSHNLSFSAGLVFNY